MNQIRSLFALLLVTVGLLVSAQAPSGFNYQAVITGTDGKALSEQSVTLRLGVFSGISGTIKDYEETHILSTSTEGLIQVVVGQGSVVSGNFSTINWGSGNHFLKVEVDKGQGFVNMGMMQMQSVPYALFSTKASELTSTPTMKLDDLTDVSSGTALNGAILKYNGSNWVPGQDLTGPSYSEGTGISINGSTISARSSEAIWNAGILQGRSLLATAPSTGDVVSWNGTAWAPAAPTGTTYSAGNGLTLSGNSFSANAADAMWNASKIQGNNISAASPSTDDVLKWDGSKWIPGTVSGTALNAGTGISISSGTISATHSNAMWNADKLQGRTVSNVAPATNDVLKWNGSSWAPAPDSTGGGSSSVWSKSGNNIFSGSSDRVGINRRTPNNRLHVWDSITATSGISLLSDFQIYARPNSSSAAWSLRGWCDINSSAEAIGFLGVATGSSNVSGATGTGIFALASTNATNSFAGQFLAEDGSTRNYGIYAESNGTGSLNIGGLFFSMRNSSNSNYGLYAAADSASNAIAGYFDGDLTYTGTLTGPSDRVLKQNIQPLGSGLQAILSLQPKTYEFRDDVHQMQLPSGPQFGFIAQELETVFPNLVKEQQHILNPKGGNPDLFTYKSVDYISLIPVLTKAIQEQQATIEALQKEVELLKADRK